MNIIKVESNFSAKARPGNVYDLGDRILVLGVKEKSSGNCTYCDFQHDGNNSKGCSSKTRGLCMFGDIVLKRLPFNRDEMENKIALHKLLGDIP